MRDEKVVDVEQEPQVIPLLAKLALIALRLVVVDPVVHGDGDRGSHLLHERENVVGVGVGGTAAEAEDADLPVGVVSGSQHVILRPWLRMNSSTGGCSGPFFGDRDDGSLLCFPDGRRRPMLGDRRCDAIAAGTTISAGSSTTRRISSLGSSWRISAR